MNNTIILGLLNGIHRYRVAPLDGQEPFVQLNKYSRMIIAHLNLLLDRGEEGADSECSSSEAVFDMTDILKSIPFRYSWSDSAGFEASDS